MDTILGIGYWKHIVKIKVKGKPLQISFGWICFTQHIDWIPFVNFWVLTWTFVGSFLVCDQYVLLNLWLRKCGLRTGRISFGHRGHRSLTSAHCAVSVHPLSWMYQKKLNFNASQNVWLRSNLWHKHLLWQWQLTRPCTEYDMYQQQRIQFALFHNGYSGPLGDLFGDLGPLWVPFLCVGSPFSIS